MRRSLLVVSLGVIAAAAACKGSDEAPKVSASSAAPAGRVLEVSGTVAVAGTPLAQGDTVVASAVIDTGADGNVVIELLHNLARWELGPNKHVRVDASLAWREAKRTEPAPQVEHEMSSAGRPAERMAAETAATTRNDADDKGAARNEKRPNVDSPKLPSESPAPKDGAGLGGIGISGTGEGGGGTGTGIGLGGIGTIGHGAGTGTGTGHGAGNGSLGGSHKTKAVGVRPGDAQVSGQLPPEVIKRIVRQNFGKLRYCYEKGLLANPSIAGKVVVKFVVGRDGAVSMAQDAGSTLGDATVVSCVVNAFKTLSFPAPDGGIVTVTYPIVFSPAGE